jgi:N-carbamoyl-L-amino-acid hydrolase
VFIFVVTGLLTSVKKRNSNMKGLVINAERLWGSIIETANFGHTSKGGICRLTLSDEDRQVRDWFVKACKSLGCTVTIDEMGNIFARRSGKDNSLPPIAMGSHLDTQPSGGKFDGITGVLSGLEVLHTLNDDSYITKAPLELIDWTNEEGTRFNPPMLASGVFASVFDRDFAYSRADRNGKRFGDELERIGYRGKTKCGNHQLGAYFELHIEQGPVLEAENIAIGVVTGVQGQRWYDVTVFGRESHAGSTPMYLRKDAMLACAEMVREINGIALSHTPLAVSTVGLVEVKPNSRNVIPGSVFFSVDLRHPNDTELRNMDTELKEMANRVAKDMDIKVSLENIWNSPSMEFDKRCINIVRSAVEELGYSHCDMISGAGHDAVYVARVAPTTMIFIPCEHGISHNEAEKIRPEDAAAGANVLLSSIVAYDKTMQAKPV